MVDTIVNAVRPFLKEKIRQRIHFHSTIDTLYKSVPKAMLPTEYGGDAGNIKDINGKMHNSLNYVFKLIKFVCILDQWRSKMKDYTAWFKEQENSKANEALRPGSPKTADDLFGMEGTFRKLSID